MNSFRFEKFPFLCRTSPPTVFQLNFHALSVKNNFHPLDLKCIVLSAQKSEPHNLNLVNEHFSEIEARGRPGRGNQCNRKKEI
jgi:hypothetical protein